MDPRIEGDPTGSRWVGGDGVSCRRRAPRRRKASGKSGFGAAVAELTGEVEEDLLPSNWWRWGR